MGTLDLINHRVHNMSMELNQLCKNFEAAANAAYEARHALEAVAFPILKELGEIIDFSDSIEGVDFHEETGGLTLEINYFSGDCYTTRYVTLESDIVRAEDPIDVAKAIQAARLAEATRLRKLDDRRREREKYIRNAVADAERAAAKMFDNLHPPE